jgi:hypothetical protein
MHHAIAGEQGDQFSGLTTDANNQWSLDIFKTLYNNELLLRLQNVK